MDAGELVPDDVVIGMLRNKLLTEWSRDGSIDMSWLYGEQPELPKVVLVGDSIRLGYAPLVAKRLEGKARVVSAEANGGDSANVLAHLDEWVIREKPAVVHLNCGLHDLKLSKKTVVDWSPNR